MCNCQQMARDWSETQGGKYPPSTHSPMCEDFKTIEFMRIEVDGSACIVPLEDADEVCNNIDVEFKTSLVSLTAEQFENLPESTGF
ncbi:MULTISPECIES: hypothetical protein [Aeromonas]|uniref:Uncharacterized protein n=1 Tax=Aeromonas veronii TaxID=654 RepID=A0A4S5CH10_AERVE|nr:MULTISPECIES: hypothetical protein [Aeromonas]THJ44960.1 hypothetical protein E8Q35_12280 [Aeromonas veronii]